MCSSDLGWTRGLDRRGYADGRLTPRPEGSRGTRPGSPPARPRSAGRRPADLPPAAPSFPGRCPTEGAPGTFRPVANRDNDYLIDRAGQKAGKTFSGVEGIAMQDASLQESMGPIVDRSRENLVSTDNGIIMARHRLLRAVKALMDKDVAPPGVDVAHQQVRSAAVILPPNEPFKDAAKQHLTVQDGVAHASV